MFFIEKRQVETDNGTETWGFIHFTVGESPALCPCYYDVDAGITKMEDWDDEAYPHYYEAAWEIEVPNSGIDKLVRCSHCFDNMMIKTGAPVRVNVIVFAQGCVDPEITVTLDEDLARKTYLEHAVEESDEDLLTWQMCDIKMAAEKQVL